MPGDNIESEIIEILDEKNDKDILLLSRTKIKGIAYLTKRKNVHFKSNYSK